MKTVILCLFGVYDSELRTREEMEGYNQYLFGAADLVADLARDSYTSLILSGGVTNKDAPETSEAASVKSIIAKMLEVRGVNVPIMLEQGSINTLQNVHYSINMLLDPDRPNLPRDVIVVTDDARKLKLHAIIWREKFHGGDRLAPLTFEVKTLPRKDIHPNSKFSVQFMQAITFVLSKKIYDQQLSAKRSW